MYCITEKSRPLSLNSHCKNATTVYGLNRFKVLFNNEICVSRFRHPDGSPNGTGPVLFRIVSFSVANVATK